MFSVAREKEILKIDRIETPKLFVSIFQSQRKIKRKLAPFSSINRHKTEKNEDNVFLYKLL